MILKIRFRMSNRAPDSDLGPRRRLFSRIEEPPMDILTMLNSKTGCDQLQREIMGHISENQWFAIDDALAALEDDILLISLYSTIYSAKQNGND